MSDSFKRLGCQVSNKSNGFEQLLGVRAKALNGIVAVDGAGRNRCRKRLLHVAPQPNQSRQIITV